VRALYLNQFYAPDIAATAQVLSALCQDLAAAGHDISVLCSDARYRTPHHGRTPSELPSTTAAADVEIRAGVRVHRVPLRRPATGPASPLRRLGQRLRLEAEFSLAALQTLRTLLRQEAPDVVVAMSTPPTLLALALWAARPLRIPVVYWVQDVYPEVLTAAGMLQPQRRLDRVALRLLSEVAQRLYRQTAAAIVLDSAMRERLLLAGFPAERLHILEHAADSQTIKPVPPQANRLRALLRLDPDAFVVCYAGNLGRGHDFATLVSALPRLSEEPGLAAVQLLFIGEGEGRGQLVRAIPSSLAGRVHFLPPQEAALKNDLLSAGEVALVTLAAPFAGLMTPSKIYPLLAAGRPILYVGPAQGRVAELCDPQAKGGAVGERVDNGDAAGLIAALRRLVSDPARRRAMGVQARRLAETRFDQRDASRAHAALLHELVRSERRSRCAPSR
jgi:glycosyltransferase involved in cell wall biosynthesis